MSRSNKLKVFVTGGAGYIGSHTCVQLLNAGHEVLVYDSLVNSSNKSLDRVSLLTNRDCPLVKGDICDNKKLKNTLETFRPDCVLHFAGLKAVGESVSEPLKYYEVNVGGTASLLKAMDYAGCRNIVFSSSATVYGKPEYLPFDEHHRLAPTNPYGMTKWMAEQIVKDWSMAFSENHGACLRYFNPVGAHKSGLLGENPIGKPNNLMPFIAQVAIGRRECLEVFGSDYSTRDGTGERDYVHVVDLAKAHVRAAEKLIEGLRFGIFNLGTGKGTTVLELVNAFSRVNQVNVPIKMSTRRPGDVAVSWADCSYAENELGLRFEATIEDMCRDTWKWQQMNPNGYD